ARSVRAEEMRQRRALADQVDRRRVRIERRQPRCQDRGNPKDDQERAPDGLAAVPQEALPTELPERRWRIRTRGRVRDTGELAALHHEFRIRGSTTAYAMSAMRLLTTMATDVTWATPMITG